MIVVSQRVFLGGGRALLCVFRACFACVRCWIVVWDPRWQWSRLLGTPGGNGPARLSIVSQSESFVSPCESERVLVSLW